jgi:hypothetical protein
MNRRFLAVPAIILALGVMAAQARGPYGFISVGNWTGGAFTSDRTGAFSHCVAGAPFDGGIYLMVLVDKGGNWALGFAHQAWSFSRGQDFQMALTFDGQPPSDVEGIIAGAKMLRVPMPENSALIAQFRRAKTMTASTQGRLFQFRLDHLARVLPILANCAKVVSERGIAAAGEFSIDSPAVTPAQPPAPIAGDVAQAPD